MDGAFVLQNPSFPVFRKYNKVNHSLQNSLGNVMPYVLCFICMHNNIYNYSLLGLLLEIGNKYINSAALYIIPIHLKTY